MSGKRLFRRRHAFLSLLALLFLATLFFVGRASKTLSTLKEVDPYPLYHMTYRGSYRSLPSSLRSTMILYALVEFFGRKNAACTLFAALGKDPVLGRNFDWSYSPTLVLATDPPGGYASLSIIDLEYLGFDKGMAGKPLGLWTKAKLLVTPAIPFDGMNEKGLAVGMAALGVANPPMDPEKKTITSVYLMRLVLDHAATVHEALEMFERYNISFDLSPPLHYLIADSQGNAAVVEFVDGETVILRNKAPWHAATNFYLSTCEGDPKDQCPRYATVMERLEEFSGDVSPDQGLALLDDVHASHTQWSALYDMKAKEVHIAMGGDYDTIHTFQMPK